MREIKTPLALFKIRYFQDEKGIYYKKKGDNHRRKVRPFWKMKRIVLGIPFMVLLILGFAGYKIGMNLASEKMVDELASQVTKEDYENILKDPSVQQIIDKELGTVQKSELLNNISTDPAIKETINQDTAVTNVNRTKEKQPAADNRDSSKDKNPAETNTETSTDTNKDKETTANVDTDKKDKTEEKQPASEKAEPSGLHFSSNAEVMKFLLSKFSMGELSALAKKAQGGVTAQEKAEIKNTVLGRLSTEEYNALKVYAVVEISNRQ